MTLKERIKIKKQSAIRFIRINLWVQKLRLKVYKWWYWFLIFHKIFREIHISVNAWLIGLMINHIQLSFTGPEVDLQYLIYLGLGFTFINLAKRIDDDIYFTFNWKYEDHELNRVLNNKVFEKLDNLNWEHIEDPDIEKKIKMTYNRSVEHIELLSATHIKMVSVLIVFILVLSTIKLPWFILLIILIKEAPSLFVSASSSKSSFKVSDSLQDKRSQRDGLITFFRTFTSLLEIKISQAQEFLKEKYNNISNKIEVKRLKQTKKFLFPWILIDIYETILNSSVFFYYMYQLVLGNILLGTFQYTTKIISELGYHFFTMIKNITQSVNSYRYVGYAYDLFNMENRIADGKKELKGEIFKIEFKNVWFKYQGSKEYALKNINMVVEDNARIALVGENGAGKSTFLKLLMLLYYPTRGQILINDILITDYKKSSLYKKLAVVTQDFTKYDVLTVSQNIEIYNSSKPRNPTKVQDAAKLACADTFIKKLPNKYETLLSKRLEGGTELSTGQWQRIAVARQFYADRPLIILDEPTSAIDPIAEAKIFDNLYRHVKNKTVIVVSHRYNTVKAAKSILVFKDGKIIEFGTHKELLDKKGYYAKAYEVQNEEKKL